MGEFGTGDSDDAWGKIIQYLEESDSDWSYWAIDGYSVLLFVNHLRSFLFTFRYSTSGEDETYGILQGDYVTVRHPWLVDQLKKVMPVLS